MTNDILLALDGGDVLRLSRHFSICFLLSIRPDITTLVDWA